MKFEGDTCTAANEDGNLTWGEIEKTYELIKSIEDKKPKIYYVLSEYIEDRRIYKLEYQSEGIDVYVMHPDQFPEFEFYALTSGYKLIDFRTANLRPVAEMAQ